MLSEKDIKEEIVQLDSLQMLIHAYEEIASTRMMNSRESVLTKRDFVNEINEIFDQVRSSYAHQVMALVKKKKGGKGEKVTFLSHNGKTVAVFLSANTGLYGDIVRKTFNTFMREVKEKSLEVTIVGKYGLSLFLQENPGLPYTFFDLPDHGTSSKQLTEIVKHIVQYEKIHVYYGKFLNVVSQVPNVFSISAEIVLGEEKSEQPIAYLFEPTLESILMFFEKEIFASLFEQAVGESELAKFASRVVAMDKAAANLKGYLGKLRTEKLKAQHRVINRKQLNSLSSTFMRIEN